MTNSSHTPPDPAAAPANTPKPDADAGGAASAAAAAAEAATSAGTDRGSEGSKPFHPDDLIASLRIEIADLKEKALRAYADLDNARKAADRDIDRVRRNAEDEIQRGSKAGIAKFATDLLGVSDNFERAIGAMPPGATDRDPALKGLVDGVQLTAREMLNIFERYGIQRMDPLGEPFNPHMHQAVTQIPRPDLPAGTIVDVFQTGYTLDGRNLRTAMVVVATGGPKPLREAPVAGEPPSGPESGDPQI